MSFDFDIESKRNLVLKSSIHFWTDSEKNNRFTLSNEFWYSDLKEMYDSEQKTIIVADEVMKEFANLCRESLSRDREVQSVATEDKSIWADVYPRQKNIRIFFYETDKDPEIGCELTVEETEKFLKRFE